MRPGDSVASTNNVSANSLKVTHNIDMNINNSLPKLYSEIRDPRIRPRAVLNANQNAPSVSTPDILNNIQSDLKNSNPLAETSEAIKEDLRSTDVVNILI